MIIFFWKMILFPWGTRASEPPGGESSDGVQSSANIATHHPPRGQGVTPSRICCIPPTTWSRRPVRVWATRGLFVVERLATAERIHVLPTIAAAGEDDVLLRFLRWVSLPLPRLVLPLLLLFPQKNSHFLFNDAREWCEHLNKCSKQHGSKSHFFLNFASTKLIFFWFVLTIPCYWLFSKFSNFVRTANESEVSWVDFGKFKQITHDHPQQYTL
jgi:hypothetical protein